MNLARWSGKRRRSASGSDSFSGSAGDSSDSPRLPSGPVLSPPPGLGRSLKDRGCPPAGAAGTPRHSGRRRARWAAQPGRTSGGVLTARSGLFARLTRPLLPFSVCDSGLGRQVTFCSERCAFSPYSATAW